MAVNGINLGRRGLFPRIAIHFFSVQSEDSTVCPSFALPTKDKNAHSHTHCSKAALLKNIFELVMWLASPAQQSLDEENAFRCVPTSFPVRLTHNKASCRRHIALPLCRAGERGILKVARNDGEGREQGGEVGGSYCKEKKKKKQKADKERRRRMIDQSNQKNAWSTVSAVEIVVH